MEIEKTRETSWKIQLKNKTQNIVLTSVEISGKVRIIKFTLLDNDLSVRVEMNKEEFYNFLSLMGAFKDVVMGEDSILRNEESDLIDRESHQFQKITEMSDNIYQYNPKNSDENLKEEDNEQLNPEEWDPW